MAAGYEIVSITPRLRNVAGSTFARVQEVTFTTKPSGLPGRVDIPDDEFDPMHVDGVVAPAAANLEAVKAL